MTQEQRDDSAAAVRAANRESEAELAAFGTTLTPEQRADLEQAHEQYGLQCNALGEGLQCCVDVLLGKGWDGVR